VSVKTSKKTGLQSFDDYQTRQESINNSMDIKLTDYQRSQPRSRSRQEGNVNKKSSKRSSEKKDRSSIAKNLLMIQNLNLSQLQAKVLSMSDFIIYYRAK